MMSCNMQGLDLDDVKEHNKTLDFEDLDGDLVTSALACFAAVQLRVSWAEDKCQRQGEQEEECIRRMDIHRAWQEVFHQGPRGQGRCGAQGRCKVGASVCHGLCKLVWSRGPAQAAPGSRRPKSSHCCCCNASAQRQVAGSS
jgi:hypothetical protein